MRASQYEDKPSRQPGASQRRDHPFAQTARGLLFASICVALLVYASPPIALLAGILFGVTFGKPLAGSGAVITKRMLQACVVLLGFGMDLPTILRVGLHGSLFSALTIGATLGAGYWLGRKLGVHPKTSALLSAGTAICGGSAIAAVSSVLVVAESQIALALGTVFLLNAAALYLFPLLGHALQLDQHQFGMWAGVAIHDISSVVGASFGYGREALETATAVKLSRTLWIVPLVCGIALAQRERARRVSSGGPAAEGIAKGLDVESRKMELPWFIGFFLLASLARTYIPAVAAHSAQVAFIGKGGLTIVLCLIGASLCRGTLRSVGWKGAVQGVVLWVFISLFSLLAILYEFV